jgi:uncharacterized protein
VRFWDASAIVPLLVDESASDEVRELLTADPAVVAWWGTKIECISAFRRREREVIDNAGAVRRALASLDGLSSRWSEVMPGEPLRAQAQRALAVHPLRAGDAFQLAAAITWRAQSTTALQEFVCTDERLRDAASREGFAVLPAELA